MRISWPCVALMLARRFRPLPNPASPCRRRSSGRWSAVTPRGPVVEFLLRCLSIATARAERQITRKAHVARRQLRGEGRADRSAPGTAPSSRFASPRVGPGVNAQRPNFANCPPAARAVPAQARKRQPGIRRRRQRPQRFRREDDGISVIRHVTSRPTPLATSSTPIARRNALRIEAIVQAIAEHGADRDRNERGGDQYHVVEAKHTAGDVGRRSARR